MPRRRRLGCKPPLNSLLGTNRRCAKVFHSDKSAGSPSNPAEVSGDSSCIGERRYDRGQKKRSITQTPTGGSRPRPKPSPTTMTFQANVVKVCACLIDYVGDRGYQRQLREYSLVPKEYVDWGQANTFPHASCPVNYPKNDLSAHGAVPIIWGTSHRDVP